MLENQLISTLTCTIKLCSGTLSCLLFRSAESLCEISLWSLCSGTQTSPLLLVRYVSPSDTVAEVWPEVERAECLARGAALKWASGVFCRPEHLERLSQYRKRESQRTTSIHSRLKVTTQTHNVVHHNLRDNSI